MPQITVTQVGDTYWFTCAFADKDIVKAAGARWSPDARKWWTKDPKIAARFQSPEQVETVLAEMRAEDTRRAQAVENSRALDSSRELPCPDGLAYLPYQRGGIAYALDRQSVLFGDEMGLGKTIQAIGVINADPTIRSVLVACPASLKRNWEREFHKWLVRPLKIAISEGKVCWPEYFDVTIINYDIIGRHEAKLRAANWDMIILDECHYLKNPAAKRTIAIFGKAAKKRGSEIIEPAVSPLMARRRLALSGTPIPNRPEEGFGLFHYLAPLEFKSLWGYQNRYCGGYSNGFGRDTSGATNLLELRPRWSTRARAAMLGPRNDSVVQDAPSARLPGITPYPRQEILGPS